MAQLHVRVGFGAPSPLVLSFPCSAALVSYLPGEGFQPFHLTVSAGNWTMMTLVLTGCLDITANAATAFLCNVPHWRQPLGKLKNDDSPNEVTILISVNGLML